MKNKDISITQQIPRVLETPHQESGIKTRQIIYYKIRSLLDWEVGNMTDIFSH